VKNPLKIRLGDWRSGVPFAAHARFCGGDSTSAQSSSTSTTAYDQRQAVESGVIANSGANVDLSTNTYDSRNLSDNSTFSVANSGNTATTNNTTNTNTTNTTDSRDLSDHSTFSVANSGNTATTSTTTNETNNAYSTSTTDARDLSDHSSFAYSDTSTTSVNIQTADAEVLKKTAETAFSSLNDLSSRNQAVLEAAFTYGDTVSKRAAEAVDSAQKSASAATNAALGLAEKSASIIADNNKTADQQNTEKVLDTAKVIAGIVAAAVVVKSFV